MLTVVGARPQFVKAAVVSRAAAARSDLHEIMVHTGQHFDANMSEVFFEEMGIPRPDYSLDIHGGGHGAMTGRMMIALEEVMQSERPDIVLVYGDTNSTLAGALCAAKLNIPVAHVEAGLRSFDRAMPEEINRVLVDHLSALLFCPTDAAVRNLALEGVVAGVAQVGDVMFDATLLLIDSGRKSSVIMDELGLTDGAYALATLHRASTTDEPGALKAALDFLKARAQERQVILPLHPRTRAVAERLGLDMDGLTVIEPVGPVDMHRLLAGSVAVYTDSGGLQKEAYFHRKPAVTLRDTTEWVETVESGWNRLWRGPDYAPRRDIPDYGDGRSAEKILDLVCEFVRSEAGRTGLGAEA
jgi:UDP-GlcNAc3NAcA epimerase